MRPLFSEGGGGGGWSALAGAHVREGWCRRGRGGQVGGGVMTWVRRYVRGFLLVYQGLNSDSRIAIDYVLCHSVSLRCFGTVGETGMVIVRRKEAILRRLRVIRFFSNKASRYPATAAHWS